MLIFSYAFVNDTYTLDLVTWTIIALVFTLIAFNYAVIVHVLIKRIFNYLRLRHLKRQTLYRAAALEKSQASLNQLENRE